MHGQAAVGQCIGHGLGVHQRVALVAALTGTEEKGILLSLCQQLLVHKAVLCQIGQGSIAQDQVICCIAQETAHIVQAGKADGTREHLGAAQAAVHCLIRTGVHAHRPEQGVLFGTVQGQDAGSQLACQVIEIFFLHLGPAAGSRVPGQQALGIDAVGAEQLHLALIQQRGNGIGHPVVFPVVKAAAPRGQSQHRRTGMAVDLELHVAAQHPAPFLIIRPLDHGSILLLSHKLIALGVIGVPHSGKPGTQRGLVLIQILAQRVQSGVEVPQFQVDHAQQHDRVIWQSHRRSLQKITKKPATRQSDRQMQLLRQRG